MSYYGLGLRKGLELQKKLPLGLQETFVRVVHKRLFKYYIRTSDDLSMLGVPESVTNLAV